MYYYVNGKGNMIINLNVIVKFIKLRFTLIIKIFHQFNDKKKIQWEFYNAI